jgi:hypothetical protein
MWITKLLPCPKWNRQPRTFASGHVCRNAFWRPCSKSLIKSSVANKTKCFFSLHLLYSQTCVKGQLRTMATCLQRPAWTPIFQNFNSNKLWIMATYALTFEQRPLLGGPKGGRCRQVWLYLCKYFFLNHLFM